MDKAALEQLTRERADDKISAIQLSAFALGLPNNVSTMATEPPGGIRLAVCSAEAADVQEVVIRVQGALCSAQLPPIRAGSMLPDKGDARFMKQTVRLTGFGCEEFKKSVDAIASIAIMMGENVERGDLESWTPVRFRNWQALDIGNRYFVYQHIEGDAVAIPMPASVDPDGVLASIAGEKWVYTEENEVSYFRMRINGDGKAKYTTSIPSEFKVGDLVEAQFSVLAVRRRGKENIYSLKLVLRALTLLDDTHGKTARAKRMHQAVRFTNVAQRGIKRTIGYMDDEEDDDGDVPTSKMTKLTV
ncbi:hypothetical protein HWV62_345 [Athelia sp. TMB]|nr:hypothetical protein HWV62_345 [Athelia sp. TMB]